MTGRLILSLIFCFFLTGSLFSTTQNVTIYGSNPDYSGTELEFFIYKEKIFNSTEPLAKTIVSSDGSFSVSIPLDKTQCIYCQTPLFIAFIYTEPGKTYAIHLPPLPDKTNENTDNPFFIPPLAHMLPLNASDTSVIELNSAINRFNEQYDPFLNQQILRYYDPVSSRSKLDSFIISCSKLPVPVNNDYYITYCFYKIASLGFLVNQFSYSELYEKYLKDKPVRSDVPSWWDFFNLYFDRYFISLSGKKEFSGLYSLVGDGNYHGLDLLLKIDPALQNDQIREWVIIREIRNEFYEHGLPLSTVFKLCDSLSISTTDKLSISISEILKQDVSALLPGNPPPDALLLNMVGDSLRLSSLNGKYFLVGFCSLNHIECMQEFEYLKYYFNKHGRYLDIVIIVPENEKDLILSFTDENSIPWKFWYCKENNKILKEYKVKAFPVFYLFDRNGILIQSPAAFPSGNFEQQLFSILKTKGDI